MSYPMNEFETDLEKPHKPSREWLACAARPGETDLHVPDYGITPVIEPVRNSRHTAAGRPHGQSTADNAIPHGNSYPRAVAGSGTGALLGFLAASGHNGKSG